MLKTDVLLLNEVCRKEVFFIPLVMLFYFRNMAGSLSDSVRGSTSSLESEVEDTVWTINDEQRDYYTNQFKTLQPNVMDIIKGIEQI